MSWRKRPVRTTGTRTFRRWSRIVICCGVIAAVVGVLIFGRHPLASWTRRCATRQIEAGAVSTAQQWLAWADWLKPKDWRTDLLRAVCFRRQHQEERWLRTLALAETNGASPVQVGLEIALGGIRAGRFRRSDEEIRGELIERGVSPEDIGVSLVYGYLVREELARTEYLAGEAIARAELVLDAWEEDRPGDPHVAYMRGIYWLWLGDHTSSIVRRHAHFTQAESELQAALSRQPRHEAARMKLAELFEGQNRFDRALEQYAELVARFPTNQTAKVSLARVLRKLGRLDEARTVIAPLASSAKPTTDAAAEMGQLELETGNFEEAERWFSQAGIDQTDDFVVLDAAARMFAVRGKPLSAESLYSRIDANSVRIVRIADLRDRLALDSSDKQVEDEFRRLSALTATPSESLVLSENGPARENQREIPSTSAAESYERYCAACHGASGDGNGRAARHLFPKPRDLRTGKARLVSTLNGIPTPEDIEAVIEKGMPGTSMRSFKDLGEERRRLLAEEVLRLNREGIRSQMIGLLRAEGEEIDEDEVRQVVEECATPGEVVPVPRIGRVDSRAIARGKGTYFELGCRHCHGDDGVGVEDNPVYDEKGQLARPRDLVHEPLKGGREAESVFLRIVAGMPGSPHPATLGLTEEALVDLADYCLSLSQEPKLELTNRQRANRRASPAYFSALSGALSP